jgi:hypothetical protein
VAGGRGNGIRDLDWLEKECTAFAADYEGRLAELDADAFLGGVGLSQPAGEAGRPLTRPPGHRGGAFFLLFWGCVDDFGREHEQEKSKPR